MKKKISPVSTVFLFVNRYWDYECIIYLQMNRILQLRHIQVYARNTFKMYKDRSK